MSTIGIWNYTKVKHLQNNPSNRMKIINNKSKIINTNSNSIICTYTYNLQTFIFYNSSFKAY